MKIISIIPARGGSKSLPKKNLVDFLGVPLINKTIEQSISSLNVQRTIVSTDDKEIKEQVLKYDIEVIDRPENISGDEATTESAMIHVLDVLKENENYIPDIVVLLQVTSPLRKKKDIKKKFNLMRKSKD